MFQGDECSGGWVSRGMGVPDTPSMCSKCRLTSPTIRIHPFYFTDLSKLTKISQAKSWDKHVLTPGMSPPRGLFTP